MKLDNIRELLDECAEGAVIFDNPSFDKSILGVDTEGRVVYSLSMMIDELAQDDNIPPEEALDFIEYNTIRAMPYINDGQRPIIIDDGPIWWENSLVKKED